MKIVARKGSEERRVRLVHWWPGRKETSAWMIRDVVGFRTPIPADIIYQAMDQGTRYLTYVSVLLPYMEISAWARCCPKDQPTRAEGRAIVLERLGCALEQMGWRLEVR